MKITHKDSEILVILDAFLGFTPTKYKLISKYNLTPSGLWTSSISELKNIFKDDYAQKIDRLRENLDIQKEIEKIRFFNKFITICDKEYPESLKNLYSPPLVIYYRGDINLLDTESISIVGNRKMTDYGKTITEEVVQVLSEANIATVSGLALGIDTVVHETTLKNNGKTIAVLGNGLSQIYPTSNTALGKRILASGGLIISEYSPLTPPLKQNFPARNRIIAAISRAVVVTEAGLSSGSLITATEALEQNKDLFAVPGSIYDLGSQGTNSLIKMGANVILNGKDVLDYYGISEIKKVNSKPEGITEEKIFSVLKEGKMHVDDIIKNTKLESQKIISALTLMEIKGKVRNLGGMVYILE